jgi:hypothetical protein
MKIPFVIICRMWCRLYFFRALTHSVYNMDLSLKAIWVPNRIKLQRIPIIRNLVNVLKSWASMVARFIIVWFVELYGLGIVESALTYHAGAVHLVFYGLISFALFILNLIPFIPIEGFQEDFFLLFVKMAFLQYIRCNL